MTTEDLSGYNALNESDKQEYEALKFRYPNWNHKQLMAQLAQFILGRNVAMRDFGFDIANSENLSEDQKNELIKSVHGWLFSAREFTSRDMGLLFRVRNEYHIRNSGLYYIANSFKARISSFLISD